MTSEFECETRFQESQESWRSDECDASGFDEFQGGTRHGSHQGGVTLRLVSNVTRVLWDITKTI